MLAEAGIGPVTYVPSAELYKPETLTPPNLDSIAITPGTSALSPGTSQQFIATGTFSNGSTEQLASVTWSSSNASVAEISNDGSNRGVGLAIAAGTVTITATAGSVNGSATLTVGDLVPAITSISPSSATAGSAGQTLTINGTNFLSNSTVTYNGAAHAATYVSASQLTIQLSSSDQATAGTYAVVVTNTAPGGGASNSVNFTVDNPVPTIGSLSPTGAITGAANQTLTISGTGFVPSSTVTYNGVTHTATYVSATQLTIQLSNSDQATAGTYAVVETNPAPGGGSSNSLSFAVEAAGTLTIIVQGLPSGVTATVTVSGPGAYNQTVNQTTTLNGLAAGNYSAVASIAAAPSSNNVYIPSISGSPSTESSSSAMVINVSYSALSTTWTAIGPSLVPNSEGVFGGPVGAGKATAIVVSNSNPSVMILGGGIGQGNSGPYTESGIYVTTNRGNSWTQSDSGLTDPPVNALWLDQNNPNIVLAGTNSNTGGIFLSTNGGSSWSLVSNSPPSPISGFLLVGGTLYAAAANGVYYSTNSGSSWTLAYSTSVPVRVIAAGGGVIYAGLDNGTVAINSSGTWTATAAVPFSTSVYSIAVNPNNGMNAFVVEANGYTAGNFFDTTNGGTSWVAANPPSDCPPPSGTSPCTLQVVAFDPSTGYLYAGGDQVGIGQSTNGGSTWSALPSSYWDIRLIIPNAAGITGNILIGSDQGIFQSTNSGVTWKSLAANITSSILYGLAINGSTILTTVQDYSPISSFDGGSTWQQLNSSTSPTGESGSVLFNPGNPLYAYFFTTGQFQYSSDGGHTFTGGEIPVFIGPPGDIIAVDNKQPLDGVFSSTGWSLPEHKLGQSFTLLSAWPFSASNPPSMVVVDPETAKESL